MRRHDRILGITKEGDDTEGGVTPQTGEGIVVAEAVVGPTVDEESAAASVEDVEEAGLYPTAPHSHPTTIAIWCCDPRIQHGVLSFLKEEKELGPGDYLPFVFPGGISPSFDPLAHPKEAWFFLRTLGFYLENFGSIKRIIAINHEDCAKYKALVNLMGRSKMRLLHEHQHIDLKKLAGWLATQLPSLPEIEGYYAAFANEERTKLRFDRIV